MKKDYYFMAGLPRSGSTLLSALLNQNPRIYSSPSSPVLPAMVTMENQLRQCELFNSYPKPTQARGIIASIIHEFYSDVEKPVVIDKNRAWPSRIPFIEGYIGQKAKIICPVRDIDEILASIISLIRRNPYEEGNPRVNFVDEQLIKANVPISDHARCNLLISHSGILGQSLGSIHGCIEENLRDRLHFVEYRDLVEKPQETMNRLYKFIGEEPYEHDFNNIENVHRERDLPVYGLKDMHEVHPKLKKVSRRPEEILPKEIIEACKDSDFWRRALL